MKHLRFVPLICLTLLSGAGLAHAAPGDLDTTFATTGKKVRSIISQRDGATGVAIQSDGKIVTAGFANSSGSSYSDFAVYRCNSDGTDDTTFGSSGVVTVNFRNDPTLSFDYCNAVAIQSDGKILLAGYVRNSTTPGNVFGVARLNTNGTLDTTFGTGGKLTLDPASGEEYARSIAIQSDGKIVLAGYGFVPNSSSPTGDSEDFIVTRLTSSGAVDTTFGSSGSTFIDFGEGEQANKVLIQSDGKIVVVGTYDASSSQRYAVARLTSSGALDTSYAVGGKTVIGFGANVFTSAYTAALQSNGYLVIGGSAYDGSQTLSSAARLNTTGGLDTTFGGGGNGQKLFNFGSGTVYALTIQSDGKIILVGDSAINTVNAAVGRFNSNGTIDGGFGSGFPVITTWSDSTTYNAVALQTNGRIVAAGAIGGSTTAPTLDFAIARYVGSPPVAASPDASPSGGAS